MQKMSPLPSISFLSLFVSLPDTRHDQYLIFLLITLSTAVLALLPLFLSATTAQKSGDILQRAFLKSTLPFSPLPLLNVLKSPRSP